MKYKVGDVCVSVQHVNQKNVILDIKNYEYFVEYTKINGSHTETKMHYPYRIFEKNFELDKEYLWKTEMNEIISEL